MSPSAGSITGTTGGAGIAAGVFPWIWDGALSKVSAVMLELNGPARKEEVSGRVGFNGSTGRHVTGGADGVLCAHGSHQ